MRNHSLWAGGEKQSKATTAWTSYISSFQPLGQVVHPFHSISPMSDQLTIDVFIVFVETVRFDDAPKTLQWFCEDSVPSTYVLGGLLPVAGTECYCCLLVQLNFWWLSNKFNLATEKRTAKHLSEQKCGSHLFVAYFTSCMLLILLGNYPIKQLAGHDRT